MLSAWEVLNLAYYMASFLKLKSILAETNSNHFNFKHLPCERLNRNELESHIIVA